MMVEAQQELWWAVEDLTLAVVITLIVCFSVVGGTIVKALRDLKPKEPS